MKRLTLTSILGLALIVALGFGFIPELEQTASCADCNNTGVSNAKKIFEKFSSECAKIAPDSKTSPKVCFDAKNFDKLLPIFQASAKSGDFGRNADYMFFGESRTDTLLALGKTRTYLTSAPSNRFTVGVVVKKEKGQSGLIVKICTIDKDGKLTHQDTFELKEGNEEVSKGSPILISKGDVIQVEISGTGKTFSRAKYTLQLNKPS
jgi:hypothetical protein